MPAAQPSTFVELCAAEGLSGAGSTRKELAHKLLWLRAQLGKTATLSALLPAMKQSVLGLYALLVDQRAAPTWSTFVFTMVGTSQQQPLQNPSLGASVPCTDNALKAVLSRLLTPDIYHFIYLGASWTQTQLQDYRKLQDTMKGLN